MIGSLAAQQPEQARCTRWFKRPKQLRMHSMHQSGNRHAAAALKAINQLQPHCTVGALVADIRFHFQTGFRCGMRAVIPGTQ